MTSYSSFAVCSYRLLNAYAAFEKPGTYLLFVVYIFILYEKQTYACAMYNCIFKEYVRSAGFYYN
jgi:hypothetical protein